MSKYESKPVVAGKPAAEIYARFTDMTFFEKQIENLPEDKRAQLGEVHFDTDSISIVTPQVGALKFEVIERREPDKIVFGSPSSPIPLTMTILLKELSPASTEVNTAIEVDIPAMLRPFVGPKLQQAADKFGEMISNLSR